MANPSSPDQEPGRNPKPMLRQGLRLTASNRFSAYVERQQPAEPALPLVHSTTAMSFRSLLTSAEITAHNCPNFDQPLVYFFYGRPAYRVAPGLGARLDELYSPVCLILRPDASHPYRRLFPFDSGALANGAFSRVIPLDLLPIESFQLHPSLDNAARLVKTFFGSNASYYYGRYTKDLALSSLDFEVKAYMNLLMQGGETVEDERRFTIEISTDRGIALRHNLLAIVLPTCTQGDPAIEEIISKQWGAEILNYDSFELSRPDDYYGVIRQLVGDYLKSRGHL